MFASIKIKIMNEFGNIHALHAKLVDNSFFFSLISILSHFISKPRLKVQKFFITILHHVFSLTKTKF